MCRQLPNWRAVLCGVSCLIVLNCVLLLSVSSFFTSQANQETPYSGGGKDRGEEGCQCSARGKWGCRQSQWARHHIMSMLAAWTIAFEESYKERAVTGTVPWVPHQQNASADLPLRKKHTLRKATHFSNWKEHANSFPLWLLLQPSISVPPVALWTVRDFLVSCKCPWWEQKQAQTWQGRDVSFH